MADIEPATDSTVGEVQRLVPLDTWLHENARAGSIWRFGSPRLTGPADMGKWLRRHEARLTERGAVMRLGTAWRSIEPTFHPVLFEILGEERDRANRQGGSNAEGIAFAKLTP